LRSVIPSHEVSADFDAFVSVASNLCLTHFQYLGIVLLKLPSPSFRCGSRHIWKLMSPTEHWLKAESKPLGVTPRSTGIEEFTLLMPGDYIDDVDHEFSEIFWSRTEAWDYHRYVPDFGKFGWTFCDFSRLETHNLSKLGVLEVYFELLRYLYVTISYQTRKEKYGMFAGELLVIGRYSSYSEIKRKEAFFDQLWPQLRSIILPHLSACFSSEALVLNEVPDLRA